MSTSQSGSVPSKKIAIVAVDGISDQQPGDSVHAIANLLLYNDDKKPPQYPAWTEESISIPVEPIRNALLNPKEQAPVDLLDEKSHKFTCDFFNGSPPRKKSGYDTICIKGQMEKEGQMETEEVHLHEMYWADLSRLGNGFLQFFSELYQILFHLSSLGRQSINMAALEHHDTGLWWFYSRLYGWAVRIFTLPIPILSLFLLVAAFLSLPGLIPQNFMPIVATVISTLVLTTIIGFILWKSIVLFKLLEKPFINLSIIVITAIVTVIVHGLLNNDNNIPYYKILAFEWLVILSILIAILINQYSLRRPGASAVASVLGSFIFLAAIWNLFVVKNTHEGIIVLSFKLIEIIYSLVATSWIIFYGLYVLIVVFGLILWIQDAVIVKLGLFLLLKGVYDSDQNKFQRTKWALWWLTQETLYKKRVEIVERTKRALWTGCVSLCISSILFISVTTTLWSILKSTILKFKVLPENFIYSLSDWFTKLPLTQVTSRKFVKPVEFLDGHIVGKSVKSLDNLIAGKSVESVKFFDGHILSVKSLDDLIAGKFVEPVEFFDSLIFDPIFGIALICIALALVVAIVSFLPSLLAEIKLPDQSDENPTRRYGLWLTSSFRTVYRSLGLLAFLFAFILLFYGYTKIFSSIPLTKTLQEFFDNVGTISKGVVAPLSITITASATVLIALPSKLDNLTLGARNILDPILDIDNYFRLYPLRDNPRSRIFSRYASLLRYLCKDNKYDAIIIVAVSQGTVITADLLRYLKRENQEEEILKKPIYLLSMGSPLKQLYGLAFPHLYDWVNNGEPDDKRMESKPNPDDLDLKQWVNMFRSGDYVGRYLWRSEKKLDDKALFSYETERDKSQGDKCLEYCLGPGAHTHYWDATNEKVAKIINDLITEASSRESSEDTIGEMIT